MTVIILTILIVDDSESTCILQARLLRKQGYQPATCHRPKDALCMIEQLRPDVILLDLAMPEMTGFDIADELQQNANLRPKLVIAVTGHGSEAMRRLTKQMGFDHHLLKPLQWEQLSAMLKCVEAEVLGD